MSVKYSHILAPVKAGGVLLKSRLLCSNALPHFLQGPELYPADPVMFHLTNVARNGAAIVDLGNWTNMNQRQGFGDGVHFPMWDLSDPATENYMTQLADAMHFYGTKILISVMAKVPQGYGVCDAPPSNPFGFGEGPGDMDEDEMPPMPPPMPKGGKKDGKEEKMELMPGFWAGPTKALTPDMMKEIIDGAIEEIRKFKGFGFDGVSLHMAYQGPVWAQFLSPLCNKRTDEYGGSMENRARFPLEYCEAIKKEFGKDFLVEVLMSGKEREGGITIEDTVKFAKLAEGKVDILQIRGGDGDEAHPTGFNSVRHQPITIEVAEAIKKSGAKILTCPIGGYQDIDDIEEYIASGKTDMVGQGRALFCDFDYAKKIQEARPEDIVPCIRCNRCHGLSMQGPWLSVCSVNPLVGIAHKVERMVAPVTKIKKVAVIGGGMSGMNAAKICTERGHKVTLFEKGGVLGGQLLHADFSSFKWPLKDFKDYLVRQMHKLGVDVRLNTAATPEMIEKEGFDTVLLALGAEPTIPNVPGYRDESGKLAVHTCVSVYGHEKELGENVVLIGGSETGVETAMYLAENGHKVTLLSRQGKLAADADRVHYYSIFANAWKHQDNLTTIKKATTLSVDAKAGKVTYERKGETVTLDCDSIVISGGMTPLHDAAIAFAGCAPEILPLGDCIQVGNVQTNMRNSFGIASQI